MTEIPKEMTVGKIRFEKGDTMLLKYDRTKLPFGALSQIRKQHRHAFPGVRLVLIPEGIDITRLRFELAGKPLDPISISGDVLKLQEKIDA